MTRCFSMMGETASKTFLLSNSLEGCPESFSPSWLTERPRPDADPDPDILGSQRTKGDVRRLTDYVAIGSNDAGNVGAVPCTETPPCSFNRRCAIGLHAVHCKGQSAAE